MKCLVESQSKMELIRNRCTSMSYLIVPRYVLDDIREFICVNYHYSLPHLLIIAQVFCLRSKEHGQDFGVSVITDAVEYVINYYY